MCLYFGVDDAKSTFTRWTGPIMRPVFVRKREMSFPLSARRAMASAAIGFFRLRMFFMKLLLPPRYFPQRHEVVESRRTLPQRSATPFCQGLRNPVCSGWQPIAFTVEGYGL